MQLKTFAATAVAAGLLVMSSQVNAHHGSSGYDNRKMTVLKATITEFIWMNPHSQVKFDALDENGVVRHWNIEAPPPTMLTERGWTRSSLKPGWVVMMHFNAAQNGSPVGIMRKAVLPNGEDLWAYPPAELIEQRTTRPK
jgi:hypothetical protein